MHEKISGLQRSEIPYREIIEGISDIILATDGEGRVIYVSPSVENYLGYKPSEIIGTYSRDVAHPDDYAKAQKRALTFNHDRLPPTEFRVRAKNGEYRWFRSVSRLLYEGGTVIGRYGVLNDITDQKKAQIKLRESEAKYRSMMESFADPLCICSPDLKVEYLNPAMVQRIGRDATGESCHSTLHGLDSKCEWCAFKKVAQHKTIEATVRSPLDHRDYRVTSMPIHNHDGTVSKMSIFRDITDYLLAIKEKKKAQMQLIQAQKMESIGSLAGGIAHDFNNILSSILGFTELALDDVIGNTPIKDSLDEVYAAANRAKNLVIQILEFARQSDEKLKPTQPKNIAKEVLKFLSSTLPATIKIKQQVKSESFVMGNATQIHQILMNLCTNAAHAMENQGGTLEVSITDITADNIRGIVKDELNKQIILN